MPTMRRVQTKVTPAPGAAMQDPSLTGPQKHEWAGDLHEDGDESDPAQAHDWFKGEGGAEAWLDKADDGTLTGWVRDPDGSVYRYSDVDAWAIDVDHSGMTEAGGGLVDDGEPAEGEPVDGDEDLPSEVEAAFGEDDFDDEDDDEDDGEEPVDDLPTSAAPADNPAPADTADDDEDEEEDEEEEDFLKRLQGKSWPAPGGGRVIAREITRG